MVDSDSESEGFALDGMFTESPRPPSPEPTVSTFVRESAQSSLDRGEDKDEDQWSEIKVRLVGSHPLWGHYLWNAARAFAKYLDLNTNLYRGMNVLELGAGGGLPGLVTALNGSRTTVLTDYPDKDLLDNLSHNVKRNIPALRNASVPVQGYIWGAPVDQLLAVAPEKYDLIILSDLVFNHSQHDALLKTCELTLRKSDQIEHSHVSVVPTVLVFYTHHRPHLASRDLDFFSKAQERGWVCKEMVTEQYRPMFPDDPGEEKVRATVHGWALTR